MSDLDPTRLLEEAVVLDAVVYDIEIAKCIPDRGAREPDLAYCEGWHDHAGMGIGVLCAFDTRTRRYRVFLEDNLAAFRSLVADRLVVGFNNRGFDDLLLAANGIAVGATWDLLCALRKAAGEPEVYTRGRTAAGRTLDAVAAVNLKLRKTGSGALAPIEWQRGRRGGVIDYCLADCTATVGLVLKLPVLTDPVTMRPLRLELPAGAPV